MTPVCVCVCLMPNSSETAGRIDFKFGRKLHLILVSAPSPLKKRHKCGETKTDILTENEPQPIVSQYFLYMAGYWSALALQMPWYISRPLALVVLTKMFNEIYAYSISTYYEYP